METQVQEQPALDNPFAQEPRASSAWAWQVRTGVVLIVLLGLHFVANHFIAKGGLRDFADVADYLRNPVILVLEVLFLLAVTTHALLGVRSIVLDFGLSERSQAVLNRVLTVVGVVTVGYALWLTWVIIH